MGASESIPHFANVREDAERSYDIPGILQWFRGELSKRAGNPLPAEYDTSSGSDNTSTGTGNKVLTSESLNAGMKCVESHASMLIACERETVLAAEQAISERRSLDPYATEELIEHFAQKIFDSYAGMCIPLLRVQSNDHHRIASTPGTNNQRVWTGVRECTSYTDMY